MMNKALDNCLGATVCCPRYAATRVPHHICGQPRRTARIFPGWQGVSALGRGHADSDSTEILQRERSRNCSCSNREDFSERRDGARRQGGRCGYLYRSTACWSLGQGSISLYTRAI